MPSFRGSRDTGCHVSPSSQIVSISKAGSFFGLFPSYTVGNLQSSDRVNTALPGCLLKHLVILMSTGDTNASAISKKQPHPQKVQSKLLKLWSPTENPGDLEHISEGRKASTGSCHTDSLEPGRTQVEMRSDWERTTVHCSSCTVHDPGQEQMN